MSGIIEPKLEDNGLIRVNMGIPAFGADAVLFNNEGIKSCNVGNEVLWPLSIYERKLWFSLISIGNPHAVQLVQDSDAAPVATDGQLIEKHPRFENGVNVGFMQVVNQQEIRLRVFERGAGETLACGTGACAAVVSGIRRNLLTSPVSVETRGGKLLISWKNSGNPIFMTGPAVSVFEGEVNLTRQ